MNGTGLKKLAPALFALVLIGCSGGNSGSDGKAESEAFDASEQGRKGGQATRGQGRRGSGGDKRRGGPGAGRGQAIDVDVSDKELETFVELSKEVVPIQKEMQEKQRKSIEESSLTRKRYRQIMMAMQQKKSANMSEKERSEVQKLQKEQREQMKEMRTKIRKKVEEAEGMSWQRFNKIAQALGQDQELKQRFQKLREEKGMGGGNAGAGGAR
jgi:hypothetical protein